MNVKQHVEYHKLFETDLIDAREAIQYERREFTGALVYDEETKRAIRLEDAPIEYFGPSQEIDDAWDDPLRGSNSCRSDELEYLSKSCGAGEFFEMTEQ